MVLVLCCVAGFIVYKRRQGDGGDERKYTYLEEEVKPTPGIYSVNRAQSDFSSQRFDSVNVDGVDKQ